MKKLNCLYYMAWSLALGSSLSLAQAAEVPAGTQLAETQVYRQALPDNPNTLDINKVEDGISGQLTTQLFETLTIFDSNNQLKPGAAASWESSDNYKVWTFHLRPDAKWSDGEPLVAQDFVTSWTRILDPQNGFAYGFYLVDLNLKGAKEFNEGKAPASALGLKALDDHTLEVTLNSPVPWFLEAIAIVELAPVPHKLVAQNLWPNIDNFVSNGPYRLVSALPNDSYTMVKNEYYWNNKATVIDKATFYIINQNTSAYKRLQSNDLDAMALSTPAMVDLARENPEVALIKGVSPRLTFLSFNLVNGPFVNKDLRKAIQLALDTKLFEEKVLRNTTIATTKFMAEPIPGVKDIPEAPYFSQDFAQRKATAKALLSKNGYSASNPLEVTYYYNTSESNKLLALAMQGQLKQVFGNTLHLTLRNYEWKTFLADRHDKKLMFYRSGWGADYLEPSTFMSMWTCRGINDNGYCNPEYDKLFDQLYNTTTVEARTALYAQMNKILIEDAPAVVVSASQNNWAINPKLKGLNVNDSARRVADMYFEK